MRLFGLTIVSAKDHEALRRELSEARLAHEALAGVTKALEWRLDGLYLDLLRARNEAESLRADRDQALEAASIARYQADDEWSKHLESVRAHHSADLAEAQHRTDCALADRDRIKLELCDALRQLCRPDFPDS